MLITDNQVEKASNEGQTAAQLNMKNIQTSES